MTLLFILAALATIGLIGIASVTILNVLTFPRLRQAPPAQETPPVSLLVPARDEAAVIGRTVTHLLAQDYGRANGDQQQGSERHAHMPGTCMPGARMPGAYMPRPLEIIILDDHSTDGTADIARAAANGAPNLRILQGQPLPEGWLGKNWACHQLAEAAQGEILIFTDADVTWAPEALTHLIGEMQARDADLQTVWPTQITKTWTERLVVPLMAFVIVGYLPLLAVHHIPWPVFAAAMGQCLAFRRAAYDRIGGHAAIRDIIIEDVTFAKRIKRAGLNLRVADGDRLVACRMYHSWEEVRNGFAKNILAGHGNSVPFLLFSWAFHWLLWLAPWVWLLSGPPVMSTGPVMLTGPVMSTGPTLWWPAWPALLIGLGVGIRALTAAFSHQRVRDALWMPVSTLLMAIIAIQAIIWHLGATGPKWRGRSLRVGNNAD